MDKIILHSDLNNFYASVECLLNPDLRDKPVAVSGNPEKRHGVVLAKNQLAKSFGVKTAETRLEAERKCPGIVFVPPHPENYNEYSKAVKRIYYRFTDRIEPFGLDECWLDVTGSTKLFGDGREIAEKIRLAVKEEIGLTVSVGVSFTKTFAKLGSDLKKPDAVTVINRDNYREVAWSLPVGELMYVGKSTLEKFKRLSIKTIGDLARTPDIILSENLGVNGLKLKSTALGINDDSVSLYSQRERPKSVGHGTTTYRDMTDDATVKTVIYSLSDMVAIRLRRYGLFANGVALGIRDNSLKYVTRQKLLPSSTQTAAEIADASFEIFREYHRFPFALPVRALSVYTYSLTTEKLSDQMDLFTPRQQTENRAEKLEKAMDDIRARFGQSSVTRAGYIKNDYVLDGFAGDDELLPFYHG